ncbi:MAG: DUF4105 domain-containing protein [Bacteroidetes bacterium]|nr:MAG: DUF4105 domain-containing protein [Bacteroidota bacterium]
MFIFALFFFNRILLLIPVSCKIPPEMNLSPLKIIMLMVALWLSLPQSKAMTLSPHAEITMLTASPGDELYSVFGHSALRVVDRENNLDLVFNYGTFDFDTPNFYLQFTRGKLLYKLSVAPMEYFVPEYRFEGRAIYEQVLNLNQVQKQQVFDFLMINRLPENAYYHYDFFYDNCATRIRDLVDYILEPVWPVESEINEESIALIRSMLDYEFDYKPDLKPSRTFRDLLQPFLVTMPWSTFGIDLALGLPADKVATVWDFMYLPDEMLIAFALAHHGDGRPLVSEYRIIIPKTVELSPASKITPQMVMWLLVLLALASLFRAKWSLIFDKIFFNVLGITGLVIVFLWFFSDHITTKANLNILWAIPTHLYFIWRANYTSLGGSVKWYFRFVSFLSLGLLVLWPFIPQAFHGAFFPIILISLLKSLPYGFSIPFISKHLKGIAGNQMF